MSEFKVEIIEIENGGGMQIPRTNAGVRVTHIKTGHVATCETERSQYKNRCKAMQKMEFWLKRESA